ncbi:uncharacterized protein B0I36DRAFT_357727 [Microdochium trichocladiopsis]|uniref:PSP1 C-terminal domain-containing protein n=1 Tax=Microdochium trichocladiopsis TaxID=1682393 RepID=A0A9P9BWB2_9PEZI|nr:uncharacterized protein B0I36DRAFT_357727 [Microdochium trichocladiopsis]KAH7040425.1 hypothetical protein B0I36DRAFT_357727 [Microdochium trichocladiopsis]
MSSANGKSSRPTIGGIAPNSHSLLLDKLNVRRSTPDSEAMASSDDEVDPLRQVAPHPPAQHKPVRRASWLNDTSQAPLAHPRKSSFASSSMSPTTSHPSTPSAELGAAPWGAHSGTPASVGRGPQNTTFSWGTGIWNTERKEPPSRLTEVLPSPTSTGPGGSSFFGSEGGFPQASPNAREPGSNAQIPFAIPLHPTPKTYRSQSYSVGQLDPDSPGAAVPSVSVMGNRARPLGKSALNHRPSRPSMLSEMSSDGAMLGKVKEVEDDDDDGSSRSSGLGARQQELEAQKTIEALERENAILRQQQYQSQLRPRASTGNAFALGNGYSLHEAVPEESDYAVDEIDDLNDNIDPASKRGMGRRMSEYAAGGHRYPVENRKLENVKRAYWTSSLGFGGHSDMPQSRRHSFADVPARQGSISSITEPSGLREVTSPDAGQHQQDFGAYQLNPNFAAASPVGFYSGGLGLSSSQQPAVSPAYGHPYQPGFGVPQVYGNRPPSPHRRAYGMPQPRHNQSLHIVLFKCSRADVFYIQEGTGLTVKPGDLVIVEADRGTDLGTVARHNVDWQTAKDLKEHYAEEHYKWLIMFSQNAAAAQEGSGAGLMAASNGLQGGAIGGMGPSGQHRMQEPNAGELKPKLIKRLAQSHEINNLQDKEGNEAKAKRVCMQKVKEHGLNMEILDAEFQMDWKKLTFYYFADAYINFNALVTDLFKIYKTRIWMSAINPASFASPTLGLQAPSGVGIGSAGGRGGGNTNNEQRPSAARQEGPATFATSNPPGRVMQPTFSQPFGVVDRQAAPTTAYPPSGYGYSAYGSFAAGPRSGGYVPGLMQTMDPFGGGLPSNDYAAELRARFPSPHGGPSSHEQSSSSMVDHPEWVNSFQGLSLNSR